MSEKNRDKIMDRERDTEKTKRGIERGRKERDCNDMIPKKGIADFYTKKGKKVENDQKWNCFRKSNESEIIYVLISSAIFTYLFTFLLDK